MESVSTAAKKEESSSPRLGWPNKKEDILNKLPADSLPNTSFQQEKGGANNDETTNNSGVDSQLRKAGQVLSPEEQDRINTILSEKS